MTPKEPSAVSYQPSAFRRQLANKPGYAEYRKRSRMMSGKDEYKDVL